MRALLVLLPLAACTGTLGSAGSEPTPPMRPRTIDCGGAEAPSTSRVHDALRPHCVGCHDTNAEFPLFATSGNFETMVVRNERFVAPGQPEASPLIAMLEGAAGVAQMPPPTPYASLADADERLPSMGELRCWIAGLEARTGPAEVSASLNRRIHAEHLQRNLEWALGLSPTDFSTGGGDYGLEDPDALSPRSPRSQERLRQLGAPNWLNNIGRENELGTSFVQISVQLSQAWCQKAAGSSTSGGRVFYRFAALSDRTTSPASLERIRQNLGWLFLRVTGETPSPETVDGLLALFRRYEATSTRTAWVAACSGIVRHPLSLTW